MDIASEFKSQSRPNQLWNVRSFPEGNKSCYNLVPEEGKDNKYLIRASFFYGNYDSKDEAPEFKLYLGVEEWDLVKFNNISEFVFREIIHVPSTDYIDVCLVNIGSGTPFISALELRKLNNSIYVTKPSESFLLYNRLDFGSETNEIVRYQNDEYDRIWKPFNFHEWEPIHAAYISDSLSDNKYRLPMAAMRTAVESLAPGESRTFSISINDDFSGGPYTLEYLVPLTVRNLNSLGNTGDLNFKIYMAEGSTQPPILNAAEIYVVKEFKQSPTDQDDVNAIKNIKSAYKLKRNWQGDPCVPTQFLWVGLNCSDNVYNPSNITSLDLSSSQLTGKIDPSFAYLKSLQYLDLSNNSLTGPVPDFLTELHSLKTLNLSGNKLTGSVPPVLIERYDKGDLFLSWVCFQVKWRWATGAEEQTIFILRACAGNNKAVLTWKQRLRIAIDAAQGQPAILKSHNSTHIVQWINPILARGEIESIIDPKLRGDFDVNSVWKAVETAMACVPSSSIQRPTMSQVLVELKECLEIETACESTWTSRKDQETSTSSFEMVAFDIESSISIGPQAR
ncbi:leucine-rich repeat protein kinase family protein [Actinidia rufa]|uniref:Leucine-rich repeat protein kinase family protein n=1 Tax=Actinidia rufa TaxID=165716 RepID=A0A7J0GBB2_9ERIC|nr:leucine-rich repeat protein kinase family protein [Actinidia rufa]